MKRYAKDNSGIVHVISRIDTEFTLCGNAFDGDADGNENDPFAWHPVKDGPVTCPQCRDQVRACRGIQLDRRIRVKKIESTTPEPYTNIVPESL